ncbi:MAG: pitrilysin family protein, partial [Candidatus Woesearchaeota archaeon]
MKLELSLDDLLGMQMYSTQLSSGMQAYFLPLRHDVKVHMFHLFTRFGSIDAKFFDANTKRIVEVEDGTAHFLEHCAFYDPNGKDAMAIASSYGIDSNAWTSFDHTTYHMHTVGKKVRRDLDFLIGFVTTPYLTDKIVEKEQGVIAQEIAGHSDDPGRVIYENLRSALFRVSPFRRSIAGSKESIMGINKEYLQSAYDTFYHPSNLKLVMMVPTGNPEESAKKYFGLAENICDKKGFVMKQPPEYIVAEEPKEVRLKHVAVEHNVPEPRVNIGFKGNMVLGGDRLRPRIVNNLLVSTIFSNSSEAAYDLIKRGIVRLDSFGAEHEDYRGCGMFTVQGSVSDPGRFESEIVGMLKSQVNGKMKRDFFETIKRGKIGAFAKALELESPESFEYFVITHLASGLNPLDALKTLTSVTYEEVLEAGKIYLDTGDYSVSTL